VWTVSSAVIFCTGAKHRVTSFLQKAKEHVFLNQHLHEVEL